MQKLDTASKQREWARRVFLENLSGANRSGENERLYHRCLAVMNGEPPFFHRRTLFDAPRSRAFASNYFGFVLAYQQLERKMQSMAPLEEGITKSAGGKQNNLGA